MVKWCLPVAEAVSCDALKNEDNGVWRERSTVDAYAHEARKFAYHLGKDTFLQSILTRLNANDIRVEETENDPVLRSALMAILRGFQTRADFAVDQKLLFLGRFGLLSDDEKERVLEEVNQELRQTLKFLKHFQSQLSPELDERINNLEIMLTVNEPRGRGDEDTTVALTDVSTVVSQDDYSIALADTPTVMTQSLK